jgi:hypothetical protein
MEEQKTELKQLTSKIKELQLALSSADESEESRQLKTLLSQVQTLQKEILLTKSQLRQQKCEKMFEKRQKSSILSKISKNSCKSLPVKSSYIQKLSDLISNFNGKASLLNQLKKLLSKERENIELRAKLSATQRKRIDLGKDYAEITKKLSEDNDLSKKIKYLEEQIPLKSSSLDSKRKELGKIRASVQELKLEVQDYSSEYMQKTMNSLQFVQSEMKATIFSLKKELQLIDLQISEATSQKNTGKKNNYDLDKVEVKGMQVQLLEKEKEQVLYEKTRKELRTKLENSLKVLSDKKK